LFIPICSGAKCGAGGLKMKERKALQKGESSVNGTKKKSIGIQKISFFHHFQYFFFSKFTCKTKEKKR